MSRVRAVLVDLYDTLAWTEWPVMRDEIERELGLDGEALIRAFVTTRPARSVGTYGTAEGDLRAVLEAAGVTISDERVRELSEQRVARFLENGVHLWEDSLPTIRALRERGIRTAVVSNCDHSTRPIVERLGLVEEADAVVLSFEVRAAKPDAAIYEAALGAVRAEPADAVFIDDQVDYCDGAAALGIRTYLIMRDTLPPTEGAAAERHGHQVLSDLRSLLGRL